MEQIATCLQIQVTKFGTTPTNLAHKIFSICYGNQSGNGFKT